MVSTRFSGKVLLKFFNDCFGAILALAIAWSGIQMCFLREVEWSYGPHN
jgi:hypothetical protein